MNRTELKLPAAGFLNTRAKRVVLDVRSPGEYSHGHIPGAINLPLFSDEERARVGTAYKQQGQEDALLLGLKFVGPKMEGFVRKARKLAPERLLAVHCWRGGQRSQSMAWLFRQAGFDVVTLEGGYKFYRRHVLDFFEQARLNLIVLGGQTGSGKTKILHALRELGEQIADLEALAHHKGSAFGSIGELPQPSVEQFENDLFDSLTALDSRRRIWVENESRSIGRVFIPLGFWSQMHASPLINIEIPVEIRLKNLVADYAGCPAAELESAFHRIERKLGGQHLKAALEALQSGNYAHAAGIALHYYDKTYRFGLETNTASIVCQLNFTHGDPETIARACLQEAQQLPQRNTVPLEL